MRQILTILTLFLLVVTSCQKSVKDLSDAMPADASYVVSINTQALLKKSDDARVKELLKKELTSALETFSLNEKKQQLVDEFLKDPTKIGFDFERNIYVYKDDKVSGLLVGIDDKDRVKTILTQLDLAKEDDIKEKESVYTFSPGAGLLVAWDDSRLLIMKTEDESENLSKLAIAQLHHTSELSLSADKSFQKLELELKDVGILQKEMTAPIGQIKSAFSSLTSISFEAGKVVSTSKIIYKDETNNVVAKLVGEIQGAHSKYLQDGDLVIQTNFKGSGIYDYLEMGEVTREAKMFIPNMKEVFANFDGDATLIVKSNVNGAGIDEPKYFFFAEIQDPTVITKLIDGLSRLMPIKKESATSYSFSNDMSSFYLKIDGQTLCISNSNENIVPSSSAKGSVKNKLEITGRSAFFQKQRDLEELKSIDNFKLVVPDDTTIVFTVDMADKQRNSFASILEIALENKKMFSKYLF